jgi:hypothetical protein
MMKPKAKNRSQTKSRKAKSVLRLLDLEHAKAAVLDSLGSEESKRG